MFNYIKEYSIIVLLLLLLLYILFLLVDFRPGSSTDTYPPASDIPITTGSFIESVAEV